MAQTAQLRMLDAIENEAQRIFALQRAAYLKRPYPSHDERIERLDKLEAILIDNADAIAAAIQADFGHRCEMESKLLEVYGCVDGIRYTRRQLAKWMKPERRHVSMAFFTGRARVIPQPKGVVGIVAPWNYPLFLAVSPLISVIAAGNRAMIKMASNTQTLARLLHEKFSAAYREDEVAILPGVAARDFSTLPYDHLIFTGSADAGRNVMRAAAENLTPVTLELGGKSPTIICEDYDVATAASHILYGKLINAGQTCLAPDYLFVPKGKTAEFVAAAQRIVAERYPDTNDPSYTSVIDEKSYRRLCQTLDDARDKGAEVVSLVPGAAPNDQLRKLPPHLVLEPSDDMIIMREEIFGPLLPVKTYGSLDEVIAYVNERDRPLGFYFFTNDSATEDKLLYSTISGGVTINNCILHVAQHDMPFGGIGASGMGQYHAREGFLEFSKLRPVFTQPRLPGVDKLYPPYTSMHHKVFDWLMRFGNWIR